MDIIDTEAGEAVLIFKEELALHCLEVLVWEED